MMRRSLCAAAVLVALAMLFPATSSAQTEAQLKARLDTLKRDAAAAGDAYSKAYWALDESEVRIAKLDKAIRKTNRELKTARGTLNSRASSIYRREELDFIGFLLGASSFESFVSRFEFLSRIGTADAEAVSRVTALHTKLTSQRRSIAEERTSGLKDVKRLRSKRDALQRRLKSKEAEFRRVKEQLDSVRSGGRPRPGGIAASPGPNGMVFPVVGSYYYSDTWGASRSGGRRRHQGTDVMAPRGTKLVAIMSGTVRTKSNRLGGKTIWLTASNGWQFYYAHLDSYVVTSGRVKAGQVIGTVGSTGNASASSPHLHLQIHPGGGRPVNPFPYLRSME